MKNIKVQKCNKEKYDKNVFGCLTNVIYFILRIENKHKENQKNIFSTYPENFMLVS